MGGIAHQAQVVAGLIVTIIMMTFYTDLPLAFGLTPVFGFHGGQERPMQPERRWKQPVG